MADLPEQEPPAQPSENAEKKAGLGLRVASALVLIPVAVGAAWLGGPALGVLIALACAAMGWEWSRLTAAESKLAAAHVAIPTSLSMLMAGFGLFEGAASALVVGLAMTPLLPRKELGPNPYMSAVGIVYVGVPSLAMMALRGDDLVGIALLLWLFGTVWAMDSGAYFAGKSIGGPKMAPRFSPNKTWAGLIGGMIAAGLVAVAMPYVLLQLGLLSDEDYSFVPDDIVLRFSLGAVLGAISQAGDILESALKRRAGVKDASNLIPGHGGVMDRVDGLIFAAPIFWLFVYLMTGRIM